MSFDFSAVTAPFRMQPGLRRLAPGAVQLPPLDPGSALFAEKLAVLAGAAGDALVAAAGYDALPALQAAARQAAADGCGQLAWDGTTLGSRPLGLGVTPADGRLQCQSGHHGAAAAALAALAPAWRAAGLLALAVRPDLAVVDGRSGTIPWLAVCVPSHWDPREKVGRHFSEVHAPVADNAVLLAAGAHLMRLVCDAQRWERFVWTLTPRGAYDQHPRRRAGPGWSADADADTLAAQAWLRTERQTFIPLPQHQQAVFTIQVEVQPLRTTIATAADARRVHDALASMSPAVLAYRGLRDAQGRLLQWLAARAAPCA